MSYCTPEDVESLMQVRFDGNTLPTYFDVEQNIAVIAADLDGVAQAAGYTVPVTATQAKALMKFYNIRGAACESWHSAWRSDAQLPPNAAHWCDSYKDFLSRLRKGEQQLPGLDPESDNDPVFEVAFMPGRDAYWNTREDDD